MESTIIVAVIAAIASLTVSLVTLISAVSTSRQSALATKQIEQLKFTFSKSQETDRLRDTQFTEMMSALKAGLTAMQRVKDEIQLILSATGDSLSTEVAIGRFTDARVAMFETYEKHHVNLSEDDSTPFHRAKNMTSLAETALYNALHEHTLASEMDDESRRKLIGYRDQITNLQSQLRDAATFHLTDRLGI